MSVLPRTIPVAALELMTDALGEAGITLGPVKPGTKVTRTVEHHGVPWELTFCGPFWCLRGPGVEHGVGVFEYEAVERITATPAPTTPPESDDAGAPKTYAGVPVPALVRKAWNAPLGDGWRLGVRSTLATR